MALIKLHTHHISWFIPSEGSYNSLGEWIEGNGTYEGKIPCEIVSSTGEMSTLVTEDGESVFYSHTIYIEARNAKHIFAYGDKIRVTDEEGNSKYFIVKGYSRRQLQDKIWV